MASLMTLARTVWALPKAILRAPQTKLSVVMAAYIGIASGAYMRSVGTTPAPVIERVRERMFTPDGRLAERETRPRDPMREWAVETVGPWVREPLFATPGSWDAAVEQAVAVPMLRAMLSVIEVTAGIGHWLAGFIPPQVIGYGGVVLVAVLLTNRVRVLREVAA